MFFQYVEQTQIKQKARLDIDSHINTSCQLHRKKKHRAVEVEWNRAGSETNAICHHLSGS